MKRIIRFWSLVILVIHIVLSAGSCDLLEVSLEEYLKKNSGNETPGDGPWVYMAVSSGDDNHSGLSSDKAVKTFGRALERWEEHNPGEAGARIMVTEDIATSLGYNDLQTLTTTGLVDFSTNLSIPSSITAITLAGSGSGITIANDTQIRPVLYINNSDLTVILKDLTITGGKGNPGGGIYIGGGSSLIVESGVVITGNNAAVQGGGVYVDGTDSHFTMRGGEIHTNTASAAGGGVCVGSNGTFTMEGGTIRDNISGNDGGGVYVYGASSVALGKALIRDGAISGNKATNTGSGKGGGVCVGEYGAFTMSGGTIKGNESGNDGGGVYVSGTNSTANIKNGVIGVTGVTDVIGVSATGGNTAQYGAGVYVGANGTLKLGTDGGQDDSSPIIQNNVSSSTGGGIVIHGNNAVATFHHGTVSNNDGATKGGGILIVTGKLDMQGGTVMGNVASEGPGIMVEKTSGKFLMSKNARVLNENNPVYLFISGLVIEIGTDGFDNNPSQIAYVKTNGYITNTQILQGSPSHIANYSSCFNVDGKNFGTSLNNNGELQ